LYQPLNASDSLSVSQQIMLFNLIIMKAEEALEAYKEGIYLTSVASHCKKPQATGQNETTKISLSYIKLMTICHCIYQNAKP
jgi:hypothetical protein